MSDIGNAVSSVASTVGDAVEDAADAVVDTVDDAVDTGIDWAQDQIEDGTDWLCANGGDFACNAGNIVGGFLDGLLEGAQDLIGDFFDAARDVIGIFGDLLRLDFVGVVEGFGNLFMDFLDFLVDAARFIFGGYVIGGIVGKYDRSSLRGFVSDLLNTKFGSDPVALQAARDRVGLDRAGWGLPLQARHLVLRLDSATSPLWQWHESGVIDLYAMSRLLSFDSADFVPRPRTVVKEVDSQGNESSFPVTRWTLSRYIHSQGRTGRIRIYAMSDESVAEKIRIATERCHDLGIKLEWNDSERFSWFHNYGVHDISGEDEFRFSDGFISPWLVREELRNGESGEECTLLTLGNFRYHLVDDSEHFGLTVGRSQLEGTRAASCTTPPDRNDSCCSTVNSGGERGSAVLHRDHWPSYV
ncbi:MAG: hypothetical protein WD402_07695, partial [Chloroflexota bacterium]